MSKVPISFIIDDGGIINTFHFHDPVVDHPEKVPLEFVRAFAKCCHKNKVRGKFSMVPMPGCRGRLDGDVVGFTRQEIDRYVKLVATQIEPSFSITPEILTHFRAYDMETKGFLHVCEDVHFKGLDAAAISKYVGLSLEILKNVGLNPTGVTSPWMTGIDNEDNYAKGIGMAFKNVMKKDRCFYFLHCRDDVKEPKIVSNSPETGTVVSIPTLFNDPFWVTQKPHSKADARLGARDNINALLAPNGRSGEILEVLETGRPLILITHWQSLFSDGAAIGLEGFDTLTHRINKVLGEQVEWMNFEEIMNLTIQR